MPHFPPGTGISFDAPQAGMIDNNSTPPPSTSNRPASPSPIRIKNRRKRYLDLHPDYCTSLHLELADPLLYDRLIRRFQSSAEREAEGRRKGYSGTLEADLQRSEAKIDALANPDTNTLTFNYSRGPHGEILAEEAGEIPTDKEQAFKTWKWEMETRFMRGADQDFDYQTVDATDEFDDIQAEEREEQEKWFEEEEATFAHAHDLEGAPSHRLLQGETGIQDF